MKASNLRDVSFKELQEHDGRNGTNKVYTAIDDIVYQITPAWLASHPGGDYFLSLIAGRDATELVESYHMTDNYIKMLGTAKVPIVGKLKRDDPMQTIAVQDKDGKTVLKYRYNQPPPVFQKESTFYNDLKRKINAKFMKLQKVSKVSDIDYRTPNLTATLNVFFIFGLTLASYIISMYLPNIPLSVAFIFAILSGLGHHLLMVHVYHDLSHAALTRFPKVWYYLGYTSDAIIGHSYDLWAHRHSVAHHVHTNLNGIDPDLGIYHASPKLAIAKYRAKVAVLPTYLQIVVYMVAIMEMQIDDVFSALRGAIENTPLRHKTEVEKKYLYAAKVFYLLHRLIVPIMLGNHTTGQIVFLFFIAEIVAGLLFGILSQITHVTENVSWLLNNPKDNSVNMSWAESQVVTAVDYGHDSVFWTYISGYLNYQVVHHLFPGIAPQYYRVLLPIIIETCKEHKVDYKIVPGFTDAFVQHWRHLYQFQGIRDKFMAKVFAGKVPLYKLGPVDTVDYIARKFFFSAESQFETKEMAKKLRAASKSD